MPLEPIWLLQLNPWQVGNQENLCHSLRSIQLITIINLTQVTHYIILDFYCAWILRITIRILHLQPVPGLDRTEYGILQAAVR